MTTLAASAWCEVVAVELDTVVLLARDDPDAVVLA
jgi:hypothetical protein